MIGALRASGGSRRRLLVVGFAFCVLAAAWPARAQAGTIAAGLGAGGAPQVGVHDGATGAQLSSFLAYSAAFTGGVRVAAGDINGDGFADVVTGAGPGGASHVKAFDGQTGAAETLSFFAGPAGFGGGVYVGASPLDTAVTPPSEQFGQLLEAVESLPPGKALTNKVRQAQEYLAAGNVEATCSELDGFISLAKAQSGKKLTKAVADALIDSAQQIQAALGCP